MQRGKRNYITKNCFLDRIIKLLDERKFADLIPVNDMAFETVSHKVLLMILIETVSERSAEFKISGCIGKK